MIQIHILWSQKLEVSAERNQGVGRAFLLGLKGRTPPLPSLLSAGCPPIPLGSGPHHSDLCLHHLFSFSDSDPPSSLIYDHVITSCPQDNSRQPPTSRYCITYARCLLPHKVLNVSTGAGGQDVNDSGVIFLPFAHTE